MTCESADWTVPSVPVDTAIRPGLVFGLATNADRPCAASVAAFRERCEYESRTRCQTDRPYAVSRCPRRLLARQAFFVLYAHGFRLPRGRSVWLPIRLAAVRPVVPQYLVRRGGCGPTGAAGRASDKTDDNGRDLDRAGTYPEFPANAPARTVGPSHRRADRHRSVDLPAVRSHFPSPRCLQSSCGIRAKAVVDVALASSIS